MLMYGDSPRQPRTIALARLGDALLVAIVLLLCPAWVLGADEMYQSADLAGNSDQTDASAQNSTQQIEGVDTPPREMHFCWTNCFTLTFGNGVYSRTDGSDETWTVERFTSATFVLHRHDVPAAWNGFRADVVYQGQISNDRLISITVNGNPAPDINFAWGFALETLPGSNAERDRRRSAQDRAQGLAVHSESPPNDVEPAVDVELSAVDAPPPLLNYEQAPCPEQGYLWTPGYWSWAGAGYYWVPGVWVEPPRVGVLWTPGYWAFMRGIYVFHAGYWGPHMGYYGGINYGYGYFGSGFVGGRWVGNSFAYNRAVSNLSAPVIHNSYSETAVNHAAGKGVSYNGGPGGATVTPTAEERATATEPHLSATPRQRQIVLQSARNPDLMARTDSAHPVNAATKSLAVVKPAGVAKADGTTPATTSAAHSRTHVQPNTTLHAQGTVGRPVTRDSAAHAHDESDSEHPPAPKPTRATPAAKPQHLKP
jgi:YXWGXW repeat-containing protein